MKFQAVFFNMRIKRKSKAKGVVNNRINGQSEICNANEIAVNANMGIITKSGNTANPA